MQTIFLIFVGFDHENICHSQPIKILSFVSSSYRGDVEHVCRKIFIKFDLFNFIELNVGRRKMAELLRLQDETKKMF